jgi:hypothetical protein
VAGRGALRLREALRARAFPRGPSGEAAELAAAIARGGGASVRAVVFFGSRKTKAGYDPWSAYDFFVITRDYRSFYTALRAAGAVRRSPVLAASLNAILPPNQISILDGEPGHEARAKCAVISMRSFLRETSESRRDHFCVGRLFQPVEVLHVADDQDRERVLDGLVSAHTATYAWVRPWLPREFDAEGYCRTLLQVSLGGEIRPEPGGRAEALFDAQREDLLPVYAILLEELAAAGEIVPGGGGRFSLAHPATARERRRLQAYFRRSKIRATARWPKYLVTFEDWLEYIRRKAERHTGREIAFSERERRLPLVFLWPRVLRYLRNKK